MVAENEEASLHFIDSSYVTEPTSYLIGNYSVTEFIVVSLEGLVHYATPKEGSELAYLVEDPLSIDFAVSIDDVTQAVPEVVSTEERSVEDFGYEEFVFDIVETFDVLLGVFVYDEDKSGFELTDDEITVYADGDSLTSQALFAATSKLTFPDRFEEFKLIVSKEGYTSFDYTYSADSIKNYQGDNANDPLEIILASLDVSEGLIAYYPFNGNANDESGNGLNGKVQAATLTEDRNGNSNSAYSFDGVDDYIDTYSSFDNQE